VKKWVLDVLKILVIVGSVIVVSYFLSQVWPLMFELLGGNHLVVATWVMAFFTIVLAIFAMISGITTWKQLKAFRKAQTWDRLRAHSEKLVSPLTQWREKSVVSPGSLRLQHGNFAFSGLHAPHGRHFDALYEHVRTGYSREWQSWESLFTEFHDHSTKLEEFFRKLNALMKQRVRLPTRSGKGKRPKEWFNSFRCAEIIYNVLFEVIPASYYFKENQPKISERKPYTMSWPPGQDVAVTQNMTECHVIEEAVRDLVSEPTIVEEAKELVKKSRVIDQRLRDLREQLGVWLGIIELGGVFSGECQYCKSLELGQ